MIHLDMGRYAIYVWPVYAITAVVLIGMLADSLARARRWRRKVQELEADRERS
jgi:heme exporter protein D